MPVLGDFASPLAPRSPQEDPAFLAFLRAQGYGEAEARAEVERRVGALRRQIANQLPEFADQRHTALTGVANDYESRGVLRSSQRLLDQSQAAARVDRSRNQFLSGAQDQETAAYGDLASTVAKLRRDTAEEGLNARGRLAIDAANGGLR